MNILLEQLNHLDWALYNVVVETEQLELCDYFVKGKTIYNTDGTRNRVTILWSASIKTKKCIRDDQKLVIICDYMINQENTELEGVEMMSIEDEELDSWLRKFTTLMSWQGDIVDHLPEPILQTN